MSERRVLARKLGIKGGQRIGLVGCDSASEAMLRTAGTGDESWESEPETGNFDLVFYWPRSRQEFTKRIWDLAEMIAPNGAVWVMFPKKAYIGEYGLDFSWDEMQAAALETVLVDNKVAAFSEAFYGTRFVIRRDLRKGPTR
jgi:hypothetical protein